MCVVCVQEIADFRRELAEPSTGEERRAWLERRVQVTEGIIQDFKQGITNAEAAMATAAAALKGKQK